MDQQTAETMTTCTTCTTCTATTLDPHDWTRTVDLSTGAVTWRCPSCRKRRAQAHREAEARIKAMIGGAVRNVARLGKAGEAW